MSGKYVVGEASDQEKGLAFSRLAEMLSGGLRGGDQAPKIRVNVPPGKDIEYGAYLQERLEVHFNKESGIKAYVAQGDPGHLAVWAVRMSEADR